MIVKHTNPRLGSSTILLLRRYIYNGKEIPSVDSSPPTNV